MHAYNIGIGLHVVHRSAVLADPAIIRLIVETPPVSVRLYRYYLMWNTKISTMQSWTTSTCTKNSICLVVLNALCYILYNFVKNNYCWYSLEYIYHASSGQEPSRVFLHILKSEKKTFCINNCIFSITLAMWEIYNPANIRPGQSTRYCLNVDPWSAKLAHHFPQNRLISSCLDNLPQDMLHIFKSILRSLKFGWKTYIHIYGLSTWSTRVN